MVVRFKCARNAPGKHTTYGIPVASDNIKQKLDVLQHYFTIGLSIHSSKIVFENESLNKGTSKRNGFTARLEGDNKI